MSVPRPALDERARDALDAIDQPVSVASAEVGRDAAGADLARAHAARAARARLGLVLRPAA